MNCYDILSSLFEENSNDIDTSKMASVKHNCALLDKFIKEFNASDITFDIDEYKNIVAGIVCDGVTLRSGSSEYYDLFSHSVYMNISAGFDSDISLSEYQDVDNYPDIDVPEDGYDTILITIAFPGVWR